MPLTEQQKRWEVQQSGYDPEKYTIDEEKDAIVPIVTKPQPSILPPPVSQAFITPEAPASEAFVKSLIHEAPSAAIGGLGAGATAAFLAGTGLTSTGVGAVAGIPLIALAGYMTAKGARKLQTAAEEKFMPEYSQNLQRIQAEHPTASTLGSIASMPFGGLSPGLRNIGRAAAGLPKLATGLAPTAEEVAAMTNVGAGAGIGAGLNLLEQRGQPLDISSLLESAALGGLFNKPNAIGKRFGFEPYRPDILSEPVHTDRTPYFAQSRPPIDVETKVEPVITTESPEQQPLRMAKEEPLPNEQINKVVEDIINLAASTTTEKQSEKTALASETMADTELPKAPLPSWFNFFKRMGGLRGYKVDDSGKVVDSKTGKEINASTLFVPGMEEALVKWNPNKSGADAAPHEAMGHVMINALRNSQRPRDQRFVQQFESLISKDPEYIKWKQSQETRGSDSSPEEFLATNQGVAAYRRAVNADKESPVGKWWKDVSSYLKTRFSPENADIADYQRMLNYKFYHDPAFNKAFGVKLKPYAGTKPEEKPIAPTNKAYQVTVQAPSGVPGDTGYAQVDEIVDGQNTRSMNPERAIEEGIKIPKTEELLKMPQGKYDVNLETGALTPKKVPTPKELMERLNALRAKKSEESQLEPDKTPPFSDEVKDLITHAVKTTDDATITAENADEIRNVLSKQVDWSEHPDVLRMLENKNFDTLDPEHWKDIERLYNNALNSVKTSPETRIISREPVSQKREPEVLKTEKPLARPDLVETMMGEEPVTYSQEGGPDKYKVGRVARRIEREEPLMPESTENMPSEATVSGKSTTPLVKAKEPLKNFYRQVESTSMPSKILAELKDEWVQARDAKDFDRMENIALKTQYLIKRRFPMKNTLQLEKDLPGFDEFERQRIGRIERPEKIRYSEDSQLEGSEADRERVEEQPSEGKTPEVFSKKDKENYAQFELESGASDIRQKIEAAKHDLVNATDIDEKIRLQKEIGKLQSELQQYAPPSELHSQESELVNTDLRKKSTDELRSFSDTLIPLIHKYESQIGDYFEKSGLNDDISALAIKYYGISDENSHWTGEDHIHYALHNLFKPYDIENAELNQALGGTPVSEDAQRTWGRIKNKFPNEASDIEAKYIKYKNTAASKNYESVFRKYLEALDRISDRNRFAWDKKYDKEGNLIIRPDTTELHSRESMLPDFIRPEIDKVKEIEHPQAKKVGDAMERFYREFRSYGGKLREVTLGKLLPYIDNFSPRQLWYQNSPELSAYVKRAHEIKDTGRSTIPLNPKIDSIVKDALQNAENEKLALGFKPSPNPLELPDIPARDVLDNLLNKPYGARAKQLRADWFSYYRNKLGMSNADAAKELSKFTGAFHKHAIDLASHFNAVDSAKDITLPPSWRETNLIDIMSRFMNRYSRRLAYKVALENNKTVQNALNDKISGMGASDTVKNVTDDIQGISEFEEANRNAISGVVRAGMLGPLTGAKVFVSNFALGLQHQAPRQVVSAIIDSFSNLRNNLAESFEKGVNRHQFSALELGENEVGNTLRRVRDVLYTAQGRNWLERMTRAIAFGQGKWLAQDNVHQVLSGKPLSKNVERFMTDFGPENWRNKTAFTTDEIGEMAARYVESVQGTYDYRGLPAIAMKGSLAPYLSLSRWNIEKLNNFQKHVVNPARNGNFTPLLMSTVGMLIGGEAVNQLVELVTGRKEKTPKYAELAELYQEDPTSAIMPITYKLAGLASLSGYAGMLGDLTKAGMDIAFKNRPQEYNNPLITGLGTVYENATNLYEALQNGDVNITGDAISQFLEDSLQSYRIALAHLSPEKQQEIERANKSRDLKLYKTTHGLPVAPASKDLANPYLNKDMKQFKRTEDVSEAVSLLPDLISKAIENSNGDPEQLKKEFISLKENSYQTMPNPETVPYAFYKYLTYLSRTQGSDKAMERAMDYFVTNARNKAKSSLVPSL